MRKHQMKTEVKALLDSEEFQYSYIRTVFDFTDNSDWNFAEDCWTGSVCLESPKIEMDGYLAFVEVETRISKDFSYVDMFSGGYPGKIFAHIRVHYLENYWSGNNHGIYEKLLPQSTKLASLKLGKIGVRMESEEGVLPKHFANFCRNALLELEKRLDIVHN